MPVGVVVGATPNRNVCLRLGMEIILNKEGAMMNGTQQHVAMIIVQHVINHIIVYSVM